MILWLECLGWKMNEWHCGSHATRLPLTHVRLRATILCIFFVSFSIFLSRVVLFPTLVVATKARLFDVFVSTNPRRTIPKLNWYWCLLLRSTRLVVSFWICLPFDVPGSFFAARPIPPHQCRNSTGPLRPCLGLLGPCHCACPIHLFRCPALTVGVLVLVGVGVRLLLYRVPTSSTTWHRCFCAIVGCRPFWSPQWFGSFVNNCCNVVVEWQPIILRSRPGPILFRLPIQHIVRNIWLLWGLFSQSTQTGMVGQSGTEGRIKESTRARGNERTPGRKEEKENPGKNFVLF